jgi:hypothetical protein
VRQEIAVVTKFFLVSLAALACVTAVLAQEKALSNPPKEKSPPAEVTRSGPGQGTAKRTTTISGKVTDVDVDNRLITIATPKGDELTMKVGPSVKRLNAVSRGDTITVKYEQGLLLEYRPEGAAPAENSSVSSTSTTSHEAVPSGSKTTQIAATVKVAKVDEKSRLVTLQTEKGRTFQLKAGPHIDLSKITVGQTYSGVYTETVAVSVEKPGAAKAAPVPTK